MNKFLKYILPTKYETVIYFIIAVGVLVITNLTPIINLLVGETFTSAPHLVSFVFNDYLTQIDRFSIAGKISLALFWAALGAAAYMAFWLVSYLVIALYNRFLYAKYYTHKHVMMHSPHWLAEGARRLLRVGALVLMAFWLSFVMQVVYPVCGAAFRAFLHSPFSLNGASFILISLLGLMVSMHLFTVLLRIITHKSRLLDSASID